MTAESTSRSTRAAVCAEKSRAEKSRKANRSRRPGGRGDRSSVSRLLIDFGQEWQDERISLGNLVSALEDRGYGLLLTLFALPNLIPNPVPGLSALFGIPLAILSAQMILQQPHPWLPQWLGKRGVTRDSYQRIVGRTAPHITKVERILRPRLPFMLAPFPTTLIAGLCLVLSLLLALPIPLTGIPLAAPIVLFGLALIQRDGACALAATLFGNAAMIFALMAGWAAFQGVAAAVPG